jgi:hypothetical protein
MPHRRRKPYPVPPDLAVIAASIKSIIRNTLLADPYFPIFYADVVIADAPNSKEGKLLARHYQKIVERTTTMAHANDCTHIKVNGVRCGSPALRGEQFCYFHQRMVRGVRTPPQSRLHPIALIEDEESIQASLMEVINALMRNTIDLKRAQLILRALHIAVRNAKNVHLGRHASNMVSEVPDYPAPPKPATTAAQEGSNATHVGTAAPGCPSGPDSPGRSAVDSARLDTPRLPHPSRFSKGGLVESDPTHRKPTSSLKAAPAPKERRVKARSLS